MYKTSMTYSNAAGSLGPLGQRLRVVTGPVEPDTASESLDQRLASHPGWAHADWANCELRPDVRSLLGLAPGPELISALATIPEGTCPVGHDGGVPGQPQPGSAPGFPCACQLIVAAGWDACVAWTQLRLDQVILTVAGAAPVCSAPGSTGWDSEVTDLAREELAPMLRVSPTSAGNRMADARALAEYPELVDLVRAGALRMYPARRISADLATLDAGQRSQVCATLIEGIGNRARRGLRAWTGTEVRSAARRARIKLGAPVEHNARKAARAARRVCLTPDVDGMSWLSAYLPEAEATRIYRRLSSEARALATDQDDQHLEGEPRTADQIRADLLVDHLLAHPGTQACSGPSVTSPTGGPGAHPGSVVEPYADVSVVIDLATLLGLAQNPGDIRGMGPIPADVARELAADGRWRAWITATSGNATVMATSPGTYTPGAALARLIRAREPFCRMPGCRARAERCDLDHTIAFPQPPGTAAHNLGPMCRRHHNLKTHYGFDLTSQDPTPGWIWSMPSGLTFADYPQPPPG